MRTTPSHMLREQSGGLDATIPYTYTNRTGDSVFLTNCNGDVSPSIQTRSGERWVDWWSPIMNECLSRPVIIAPGATYRDSLRFHISVQDGSIYQTLIKSRSQGTYRLVWPQALRSFDANRYPFGKRLPLAWRTSNALHFMR